MQFYLKQISPEVIQCFFPFFRFDFFFLFRHIFTCTLAWWPTAKYFSLSRARTHLNNELKGFLEKFHSISLTRWKLIKTVGILFCFTLSSISCGLGVCVRVQPAKSHSFAMPNEIGYKSGTEKKNIYENHFAR